MSAIFTQAPAAHLPRRRGHRPAVLLPRARRVPRRRSDQQVHLHAHPHGLPAPLPPEVLGVRGGRRPAGDPPPAPARGLDPPLGRRPAGDRVHRRRAGRHRPRLVGRLHRVPAQGARPRALDVRRRRASSPRTPARSRSTSSASRSASRTSTSRRTAASARTRSAPTTRVDVRPLALAPARCAASTSNFLLFYTGEARSASKLLQPTRSPGRWPATRRWSPTSTAPGRSATSRSGCSRPATSSAYAELMHEHWENKRSRSPGIANERIDDLYTLARRSGVIGGKLVGAGGGGFLLVYAPRPDDTRQAMARGRGPRARDSSSTSTAASAPSSGDAAAGRDRRLRPHRSQARGGPRR